MNISEHYSDIARPLLTMRPQLYLVGGDIAYANGWLSNGWRWKRWFERLKTIIEDPDGYMIPMVVAVGNHEVSSSGEILSTALLTIFDFFPRRVFSLISFASSDSIQHYLFWTRVML